MDLYEQSDERQGFPTLNEEPEKKLDNRPDTLFTPQNSTNMHNENQQQFQQNFDNANLQSRTMASDPFQYLFNNSDPSPASADHLNPQVQNMNENILPEEMEVDDNSFARDIDQNVFPLEMGTNRHPYDDERISLPESISSEDILSNINDYNSALPDIKNNYFNQYFPSFANLDKSVMHQAMLCLLWDYSIISLLKNSPIEMVIQCIHLVMNMAEHE